MTAGDALRYFADEARHRSYPVVDGEGRLLGLVSRSDALDWRVSDMPTDSSLADLVSDAAQPVAQTETPVGQVADMIVESGIGRIPVVDPATRRVIGILSRPDQLKAPPPQRRPQTQRQQTAGPAGEGGGHPSP